MGSSLSTPSTKLREFDFAAHCFFILSSIVIPALTYFAP
jgi:hypothetical protein